MNSRQKTLLIVLTAIIILAGFLYGLGGAVFLTGISGIILVIFFRGLSTESIKQDMAVTAEVENTFDEFYPWYDPMLGSHQCNIYHQD